MCAYIRYPGAPRRVPRRSSPIPIRASWASRASTRSTCSCREEPVAQRRWTILIRIVLAIPALLVSAALAGSPAAALLGSAESARQTSGGFSGGGALLLVCAVLGWFSSLARGRMPKGLRDAGAYAIGYSAQATRVPPARHRPLPERRPDGDARRRSPTGRRGIRCASSGIRTTFAARGSPSSSGSCSRCRTSSGSCSGRSSRSSRRSRSGSSRSSAARPRRAAPLPLSLPPLPAARLRLPPARREPVPGFHRHGGHVSARSRGRGAAAAEPLEDGFPARARDPGLLVSAALGGALFASAVLTWFYALVKGSAPWGLRNLSAYALRYDAQTEAYLFSLTDAYPHASPLEGDDTPVRSDPRSRAALVLALAAAAVWAVAAWLLWRVVAAGVPPAAPRRARALPVARAAPRAALQRRRAALLARHRRSRSSSCSASSPATACAGCASRRPARSAPGCCSG